MFTFDIRHVARTKHSATDALLRKPPTEQDIKEIDPKEADNSLINNILFLDDTSTMLRTIKAYPLELNTKAKNKGVLEPRYSLELQAIAFICLNYRRLPNVSR